MEKFIIIIVFSSLTFGWELEFNQCACSQLKLESECEWHRCFWDDTKKSCQKEKEYPCSTYSDEKYDCIDVDHCYFNIKTETCEEFTTCENIPFESRVDCWNSKPGCYYYDSMSKCSKFSCSKFSDIECPIQMKCEVKENKCTEYTCTDYTKDTCLSEERCFNDENGCRQATCQDLTAENCFFIYNLEKKVIQPCLHDGNQCIRAENSSQLNVPSDCYWHTIGIYHWSTNDETKGECVQCSAAPDPDPKFDLVLKLLGSLMLLNI